MKRKHDLLSCACSEIPAFFLFIFFMPFHPGIIWYMESWRLSKDLNPVQKANGIVLLASVFALLFLSPLPFFTHKQNTHTCFFKYKIIRYCNRVVTFCRRKSLDLRVFSSYFLPVRVFLQLYFLLLTIKGSLPNIWLLYSNLNTCKVRVSHWGYG